MMNQKVEMRIEELENEGFVIVNLVMADGSKVDVEMSDGTEDAVALEVVTVDAYEANGYNTDGLEVEAVEL